MELGDERGLARLLRDLGPKAGRQAWGRETSQHPGPSTPQMIALR